MLQLMKKRYRTSSSPGHTDSDESDGIDIPAGSKQSRKCSMTCERGSNLLKRVRKASSEGKSKIPMKFNTRGVPIGPHKLLFQQYVGYLARTQVSIGYTCWKSVPKQTQNAIYETLMNTFDIPTDELDKKGILTNVASKWGHFKTNLGTLTKDKKTGLYPEDPPEDYQFIDKDAWSKFVQHRSTKSFRDASRANSERSKKNMHHYRGSCQGYAGIEEKRLISQNLDPQTHSMSRADLWKAARRRKNGEYANVETAQMAKQIDMYQAEELQGTLSLDERQDVLSLALGKEDHPGRMRAVEFGVGVKKYYGSSRQRSSSSQKELIELRAQMAKVMQRMDMLEKRHKCMENDGSPKQAQVQTPQVLSSNVSSLQELESQVSRTMIVDRDCSLRGSVATLPIITNPPEKEKAVSVHLAGPVTRARAKSIAQPT